MISAVYPVKRQRRKIMSQLELLEDNFEWPGFVLTGVSSLAITLGDEGPNFQILDFLDLSGTTSVNIHSLGDPAGNNFLKQLAETTNNLITVTISGSETFQLGSFKGACTSNLGDGVVTDTFATAASPTAPPSCQVASSSPRRLAAATSQWLILQGAVQIR
jgi:hypothetical protein